MASVSQICYSEKYHDDKYEYRHVILPSKLATLPPSEHLMTETEWRNLGVQQSPAWVHYMIHSPGKRFQRWKRARTTSLNAFVAKDLQEAILSRQSKGRLSPTRSSDPQPIGLVFQKPLQPNGGQPYAIWNPEPGKRKTQSRFPQLVSHIDLTNFSCGKTKPECPWERKVQPPKVEYSLKSTTRSTYQHPLSYPEWIRPTRPSKKGISEEYAAQGIVPTLLPQINNTTKNEFLENLKLAGMCGLRALGECSAKTLEKPIVQQLVEK